MNLGSGAMDPFSDSSSITHILDFSSGPSLRAKTIPCNLRRDFNRITEERVEFESLGRTYVVDVCKERAINFLEGSSWRRFISENQIPSSVYLIFFTMRAPSPRITVVYMNDEEDESDEDDGDEDMEDEDKGDEEDESDEEKAGPLDYIIIAQRCKLTHSEECYLVNNILSKNSYICLALVTRLTRTHIQLHDMRLPSRMIFSLQISEEGLARIRAGTTGVINSISYKTMSDGHIIFNIHEWKNFVELHHDYLQVGQVILLTGRTISRCNI